MRCSAARCSLNGWNRHHGDARAGSVLQGSTMRGQAHRRAPSVPLDSDLVRSALDLRPEPPKRRRLCPSIIRAVAEKWSTLASRHVPADMRVPSATLANAEGDGNLRVDAALVCLTSMPSQQQLLEAAIAAVEAQRSVLGDSVRRRERRRVARAVGCPRRSEVCRIAEALTWMAPFAVSP